MTSMANARSRGNIPLTDVDKHCDREQGLNFIDRARRAIQRNRARNSGGRSRRIVFSRCRRGVVHRVRNHLDAALSSSSSWKSVTMDIRAAKKPGGGFLSSSLPSAAHPFFALLTLSCYAREIHRPGRKRMKKDEKGERGQDEEEGGHDTNLVGV